MSLRAFSYGGGVQSTAALVLAAQGRIDFPTFLFANVGEDSEHPATIKYVRDVAVPFAEAHGIDLRVLSRVRRNGSTETLWQELQRTDTTIGIPVRMGGGGAPGTRRCTGTFKINVVARWLREHGATPTSPAVVGVGISTDEIERATNRQGKKYERIVYPLLELRLNRAACAEIIRQAGLPVPRKSACFFCPFHTISAWRELRRDEPDLFAKSVELETTLNARRAALGKDPVYFNSRAVPLVDLPEADPALFDGEGVETCDAFSCFT